MTCAIVGDSIAVGVAEYSHGCSIVDAKIGISSSAIIRRVHDADVVVISAGSNDPNNPRLVDNLKVIRAKCTHKVIWISPVNRVAAAAVRTVAALHGDTVITFIPGRDHVHPRSYIDLVNRIWT